MRLIPRVAAAALMCPRHPDPLAGRLRLRPCRLAMNAATKARGRARAQKRLPVEMRQKLLDALYSGQPFRAVSVTLA